MALDGKGWASVGGRGGRVGEVCAGMLLKSAKLG